MKFNKERLAGAASVALRFLLWLPVLAAAAFFGAALAGLFRCGASVPSGCRHSGRPADAGCCAQQNALAYAIRTDGAVQAKASP